MSEKKNLSRINKIRLTLLSIGIGLLIVSNLCFHNVIQIPNLEICGSGCDWWWSFIIDFPPHDFCLAVCVPRNALYQPLFILGVIVISFEILLELHKLLHKYLDREIGKARLGTV